MSNKDNLDWWINCGKWAIDLLTGKRKQNCADDAYLRHNGGACEAFRELLELLGRGYKGKRGNY